MPDLGAIGEDMLAETDAATLGGAGGDMFDDGNGQAILGAEDIFGIEPFTGGIHFRRASPWQPAAQQLTVGAQFWVRRVSARQPRGRHLPT